MLSYYDNARPYGLYGHAPGEYALSHWRILKPMLTGDAAAEGYPAVARLVSLRREIAVAAHRKALKAMAGFVASMVAGGVVSAFHPPLFVTIGLFALALACMAVMYTYIWRRDESGWSFSGDLAGRFVDDFRREVEAGKAPAAKNTPE
jgi:hypothetical protein